MWLKNDILRVFFDEHRGGMPVRDNFGFIKSVAVEIAYALPPPFFQSLYDKRPRIRKHGDSKLVVSGVMQKGGRVTPHTYAMTATLEENMLNLAYRLNIARTERIVVSKIWLWTKLFQNCTILGEGTFNVREAPSWHCLYAKGGQPMPITLFDSGGKLRVKGSTAPSVYTRVLHYRYEKMEVAYGWARGLLQKGTYSGNLTLIYNREKKLNIGEV